jgi:hypothetical protein
MRNFLRLTPIAVLAILALGAQTLAQQRAATPAPKPYESVAVKLPQVIEDPSLIVFRSELAGVANSRVYADLERLMTAKGFFWDRDFGGGFDAKRAAVDNLAAAIGLERRNGIGWVVLARFAAEATAAPFTGRPGIICAPGETRYDEVDFDRLVDATRSEAVEWAAPRMDKTPVRSAARTTSNMIDTLGLVLVRILGYLTKDKDPEAIRAAWMRIATPAGKVGFVAPGSLTSLTTERLCYGKDGFGRWRIAGYVGGGD